MAKFLEQHSRGTRRVTLRTSRLSSPPLRALVAKRIVAVLVLTLLPPFLLPSQPAHSSTNGLSAYWFNQVQVTTSEVDPYSFTTNFCHSQTITRINQSSTTSSPGGNCGATYLSTYITGYIRAPHTGQVNFFSRNDDGFRLVIDGQVIINDWTAHAMAAEGSSNGTGSMTMVANEVYPIQIYHHQGTGGWGYILDWSYGSTSRVTIPQSSLGTTFAALRDSPLQTTSCQIGSNASCPALSPQEIFSLYGTTANGVYWILVNGAPTEAYILLDPALGGGSWILSLKGTRTTTRFRYADTLWTENRVLNSTATPSLIASDGTGQDAKYTFFNSTSAEQMMAIFPDVPTGRGGAFSGNDYGFIWRETVSAAGALNFVNEANCPQVSTTLQNLFATGTRCGFRTVSATYLVNETPYSTIGNVVFSSQKDIRFFGINYIQTGSSGTPGVKKKARWGFGWNENGAGNEDSNDMINGIGLEGTSSATSTDIPTGDHVGCCTTATGLAGSGTNVTRQMSFQIFIKPANPTLASPSNLLAVRDTSGTTKLTWTPPVSVTPQEYVVQYKPQSSAWSAASTLRLISPTSTPEVNIAGLSGLTTYDYRVFARTYTQPNTYNFSVTPATTSQTKLAQPDAPTLTTISTDSIRIEFDTVSAASSYTVRLFDASNQLIGSPRTNFSSGTLITGLTPFTTYRASVQAIGDGTTYLNSDQSTISSIVTFAEAVAPSISLEPQDTNTTTGVNFSFSVQASTSDGGTLSYQWFESATSSSSFSILVGETEANFTRIASLSDDGSRYRVLITNTINGDTETTLSSSATLSINPAVSLTGGSDIATTYGISTSSSAITPTGGTGAKTFSLSPALTGISIDPVTGVVTASSSTPRGSFNATITATDERGASATRSITITIATGVGTVSLTFTGNLNKGSTLALIATTSSTGAVRFTSKGRVIRGCAIRNVIAGSLTATCSWRITTHGPQIIKARYASNDANWSNAEVQSAVVVARRTSR